MHLAICAIFKNEAPYLREWIEFHSLVGVQRFHLYQNRSTDDYLSVLQPYIDEGVVELKDWPHVPPCQIEAYQDLIARYAGMPWWVAFLDCDEFLFSPCYSRVSEAIDAIAEPQWGAIGVNWMCFGASGQEEPGPGLVVERFTLRPPDSFSPNRHIKSIVRMDRILCPGRNPHTFEVAGGTFGESGAQIEGPHSERPSHSRLRINHYHTKSRQEYLRRIARGNADGAPARSPTEFNIYQAPDIEDRATWRFLPALKERIQQRARPKPVVIQAPLTAPAPQPAPEATRTTSIPRDFAAFRNYHRGETMLVCGCGSSLPTVVAPERFASIGVNDVGRLFQPDYLVVINPRGQFSGDRFTYVERSEAQAIFTQLDLNISHPNIVRFQLGRRGGTELSDANSLPYTRNSPYVALCLALHMGAKRIGLIGIDFTDHHFFASTGRHSLAGEINQINNEYKALAHACRQLGVEVFNLSPDSLLTAFPKVSPEQFARSSLIPAAAADAMRGRKVFFVNYRFLSCGDVFSEGLRHAAEDLNIECACSLWDDPLLPGSIKSFDPDLLFLVHGRKYTQHWKSAPHHRPAAVWLLDEPYEVDDTSQFSRHFDTTFVNDPSTIQRHRNAHYLPVCYDAANHIYRPSPREHRVGFIGGANPAREQMLAELARSGLLSYAIGGPWRSPEVKRLTSSLNISAIETAKLYQQTQIVVNIFRTVHHFNRQHVAAVSMNPRIYEALACGALVVSERRTEIEQLCPEMPVFDGTEEMVALIQALLNDPTRLNSVRRACIRRLAGHTYTHRLYTAFRLASCMESAPSWNTSAAISMPAQTLLPLKPPSQPAHPMPVIPGWEPESTIAEATDDTVRLQAQRPSAPGSEAGLVGLVSYADVRLFFEILSEPGASVVAKIHQLDQRDQTSNSYHVMISGANAYLARHEHIFHSFKLAPDIWHSIALTWTRGTLRLRLNGNDVFEVHDSLLPKGYCFLGIKSGSARLRKLEVTIPEPEQPAIGPPPHEVSQPETRTFDPRYESQSEVNPLISIVTTVYDRVTCLDACLRSVQNLAFDAYEQIIVADAPSATVVTQIEALVQRASDGRHRLRFVNLRSRANDWGRTPAEAGLSLAAGKYVCFLSDDNGYKPDHFSKLFAALEQDPGLGFAYSGCMYDGRATINAAPPAYGRIDLGQPLFRRDIFARHLGGKLPFQGLAWDWKMIERLMQNRVRWMHVNDTTFIFRLAKYPHLAPPERPKKAPASSTPQASAGLIENRSTCTSFSAPHPSQSLPFTAEPRRNLIYHVWPVRGAMWRWNIEQLKQRIDLFNGRRIVSIVHDHRSDDPMAVQAALEGLGCEFLVSRNHPSGEAATFPTMLRRVASTDINEATFYAHAKGVKHEPDVPEPIRRWAEISYRAALDDSALVSKHLERFALTGSFRRFGRFKAHRNLSPWHYHGTFFWMRHARVFNRNCFDVPSFYCGVEAWPGIHFAPEEAGCLVFDDLQQPATDEQFSETHQAEIQRLAEVQAQPYLGLALEADGCKRREVKAL